MVAMMSDESIFFSFIVMMVLNNIKNSILKADVRCDLLDFLIFFFLLTTVILIYFLLLLLSYFQYYYGTRYYTRYGT